MVKGRRRVVCETTWQVIKILFEGQARKADANLLLTKIYNNVFKHIDMEKIIPLFQFNRRKGVVSLQEEVKNQEDEEMIAK
jgi:hypothetical protein